MPKQQGVTVPQGKLGAPGRLVVKTLISVQTEYFTRCFGAGNCLLPLLITSMYIHSFMLLKAEVFSN